MNTLKHFFLGLLFCSSYIHASSVITGNSAAPAGQSFSFLMNTMVQTRADEVLYTAAASSAAGSTADFAVARLVRGSSKFDPLTPENVMVMGVSMANPLYNQGIAFMSLLEGEGLVSDKLYNLIAVPSNNLRQLYLFLDEYNPISLVVSTPVVDSNGATTNAIQAIGSGLSRVMALADPVGGVFGASGTGIAQVVFGEIDKKYVFGSLDAATGDPTVSPKAFPLDTSSAILKINSDLSSMAASSSQIQFDPYMQRFFVPVQATSGGGALDGARSVAVVGVTDKNIMFVNPIAPDAAFSSLGTHTVGIQGALETITARHVRTMRTSTGLCYLIVVGGVSSEGSVERRVYALPLVSVNSDENMVGRIASKDDVPEDFYAPQLQNRFIRRDFKVPATTVVDFPDGSDAAVAVGIDPLEAGDIADIYIKDDAVYVVVPSPDVTKQPGIFYSRPLFSADAKIAGWTAWQQAEVFYDTTTGAIEAPTSSQFDRTNLTTTALIPVAGTTTIVKQTEWGMGDAQGLKNLVDHVAQTFSRDQGGIQGSQELGRNQNGLLDISVQFFGGRGNLMLAQTGTLIGTAFEPVSGSEWEASVSFDQGAITQNFPVGTTKVITVAGGVLNELGPILTATAATNGIGGDSGYIVVGGTFGVAILSRADGSGWDTATGLGDNFLGLTDDMSFKKMGAYRFVRKVLYQAPYLYILTDTALDRIDMTAPGVGMGTITPVTIAHQKDMYGFSSINCFTDLIVGGDLAFLATSTGLYRNGNDTSIRTAADTLELRWQLIPLGEGVAPIKELLAVTALNTPDALAIFGGNIWVSDAYRGKKESRFHRQAVEPYAISGISDTTVQPFPDRYVKNVLSYFLNFGIYRDYVWNSGETVAMATSKEKERNNSLHALRVAGGIVPQSGVAFVGLMSPIVGVPALEGSQVTALSRITASGVYMLAGDFGLRVNE